MSSITSLVYQDNNPLIKEFYTKCMRLIMSLRIHSPQQAALMNEYCDANSVYYNPSDKTTWLYYKQISDSYAHGVKVLSLDKTQEIHFRSATLLSNPRTKSQYSIGSIDLRSLMDANSINELALWAALYPVDIGTAIASPTHKILAWDTSLIEEQEDNVIYELQTHIDNMTSRWHNSFYVTPGSFYYAGWLDQLAKSLFLKLLNIRLANCKTSRAHSFHVRTYLSGYYELDKYMDYMTREQQIYLYINIEYISRNTGQQHIFDKLKDMLLTKRKIPLSEVSVRQIDTFDSLLRPEVLVRYKPINDVYETEVDLTPFSDLVSKQNKLTKYNKEWYDRHYNQTLSRFKQSPSSVTQTKVLHSKVTDYSNSEAYPIIDALYQHWGYLARKGNYSAQTLITFVDPRDSKEYTLQPYEAFVYYGMVMTYSLGLQNTTDNTRPAMHFDRTLYLHVLKFDNQWLLDNAAEHVDYMLSLGLGHSEEVYYADRLMDLFLSYEFDLSVDTPAKLNALGTKIFQFNYALECLCDEIPAPQLRECVRAMSMSFFKEELLNTAYSVANVPTTVAQFFVSTQLNSEMNMSAAHYEALLIELFKQATGYYVDDVNKISSIQKAMVSVFKLLSSYTVQFIAESNTDRIIPVEMPFVNMSDDIAVYGQSRANLHVSVGGAVSLASGQVAASHTLPDQDAQVFVYHNVQAQHTMAEIEGYFSLTGTLGSHSLTGLSATTEYAERVPSISDNTFIVGREYYLALTPQQKADIAAAFS